MPSAVDTFIAQCSQLATKLGIRNLAIALQDPGTAELKLVASPGAKDVLKPKVAEVFGLGDVAPLQAELVKLRAEMASMGGDTGWEA